MPLPLQKDSEWASAEGYFGGNWSAYMRAMAASWYHLSPLLFPLESYSFVPVGGVSLKIQTERKIIELLWSVAQSLSPSAMFAVRNSRQVNMFFFSLSRMKERSDEMGKEARQFLILHYIASLAHMFTNPYTCIYMSVCISILLLTC